MSRAERRVARLTFRAWVRAQGWSSRELAKRMHVEHARAEQLRCGRLLPAVHEVCWLEAIELRQLVATMRAALRKGAPPVF